MTPADGAATKTSDIQNKKVVQNVINKNVVPTSSHPASISQAKETGMVKASSLSEDLLS